MSVVSLLEAILLLAGIAVAIAVLGGAWMLGMARLERRRPPVFVPVRVENRPTRRP